MLAFPINSVPITFQLIFSLLIWSKLTCYPDPVSFTYASIAGIQQFPAIMVGRIIYLPEDSGIKAPPSPFRCYDVEQSVHGDRLARLLLTR
ncbi:hypothetical protein SAMN05216387_105150 [Nitrosovibrio tenuis]|uniref:Uncharacterized protein n=1 Tax=Nitrosovibrio tenuis TaxID=1233 RepID=A0A1H7MPS8_9PROT|nr:hypothetical protein SAMN05216387_105150 [Nitrosovibrio tenuis]